MTEEGSFRVREGMHRVIRTPFCVWWSKIFERKILNDENMTISFIEKFLFFLLSNFYFTDIWEESKRVFETIFFLKRIQSISFFNEQE